MGWMFVVLMITGCAREDPRLSPLKPGDMVITAPDELYDPRRADVRAQFLEKSDITLEENQPKLPFGVRVLVAEDWTKSYGEPFRQDTVEMRGNRWVVANPQEGKYVGKALVVMRSFLRPIKR